MIIPLPLVSEKDGRMLEGVLFESLVVTG